jgi:hypothetical protein
MGNDELRGGDDADVLYDDTYGGGDSEYSWGAGWEDPRFDTETGSATGSGSGGGVTYTFNDLLNGGCGLIGKTWGHEPGGWPCLLLDP